VKGLLTNLLLLLWDVMSGTVTDTLNTVQKTGSTPKIIMYASHLNKIGGVETFVVNFCKRLKGHCEITFAYDSCDPEMLDKIAKHVDSYRPLRSTPLTADILILATAWGPSPEGRICAPMQVQMVHADYVACIEGWNFKYQKLPSTTHHVAVSKHVAKQFEVATPHKIDKVIYNLL
jgi:hypothetical protein